MLKIHGTCLQEECGEVIMAVSKIFRFGLKQGNPETGISNKDALQEELCQLEAMIDLIRREWGIGSYSAPGKERKTQRHFQWLDKFPQTETIVDYVK